MTARKRTFLERERDTGFRDGVIWVENRATMQQVNAVIDNAAAIRLQYDLGTLTNASLAEIIGGDKSRIFPKTSGPRTAHYLRGFAFGVVDAIQKIREEVRLETVKA